MCFCGRDGTSWFAQLRLLLWKNWTLKKRRAGSSCCEILFPLGAICILIMIRALVTIDNVDTAIPVGDKQLASSDVPAFLTSMACGIPSMAIEDYDASDNVERYPFESVAIAAGPNMVGGAENPHIQAIAMQMREAFAFAGALAPGGQVPCCLAPVNNTYGPSCWTSITDFVALNSTLVRTFDSGDAVDDYIQNSDYGWHDTLRTIALAAVIDQDPNHPNRWSYVLRANSTDIPWTGSAIDPLVSGYKKADFFQYYNRHVLTLQWFIESYIIALAKTEAAAQAASADVPMKQQTTEQPQAPRSSVLPPGWHDMSYLSFPVPAHRQDNFKQYVSQVFGLFLVIAFMWPFSRMVRNMMKMMGLRNSVFWQSWVITYLISFLIVCVLVILICRGSLFKYSDMGLLFLFFFSFCLSLIALACMVTTFFSRAKTAGTLSPFLLLAGYLPYFGVSDPSKAQGAKLSACLFSPVAFSLGSTNIISFEGVFVGSQWNNAGQVVDNFTLSAAVSMMMFDALLYGFLAWYLDKIWPREYGTPMKWYFFVTPSYWKSCCSCKGVGSRTRPKSKSQDQGMPLRGPANNKTLNSYGAPALSAPLLSGGEEDDAFLSDSSNGFHAPDPDFGADYEPVPANMASKVGVKVRGLRKQFKRDGNEVTAVEGLDLNLYQGQCFVLLGHNGAGKTTTISMLTGMIPTSSGGASLYGRDINHDMDEIRTFMGVCPQHDVLFDDLTVYEHLEFFGKLKGILLGDLHRAVMVAIEEVQLRPKMTTQAQSLSGGQRRRLSLAIALIGDSKIVFLDEPTSGVDPFSRRAIWDLLTKKKAGRVIVLTTHFMDEADQLGDRIGIMHHGRMKCCGTSLFLKAKFGVGYCMTLVKDPARAKVDQVTALVQKRVPAASMLSSVGSELSYSLPFTASAVFPQLLGEIDAQMSTLGIVTYGLSVTTMEEVFIKVAEEVRPGSKEDQAAIERQASVVAAGPGGGGADALGVDPTHIRSSWCTHFKALLAKRYHIQKRDKKAMCCQFLVPLILLTLGLGILRIPPNFSFPTLQLVTNDYHVYNFPNRIGYNPGLAAEVVDNVLPTEGATEMFWQGGSGQAYGDLYNFSVVLLNNRTQFKESRYGAFFGTAMNASQFGEDAFELAVMTNISAPHGLPTWANLGHQAMLRAASGDQSSSISGSIHPFSWTPRQKTAVQSINGVVASIVISLAFTFIPASFAVFVVSEREFKSKHLQLISGVSMSSYWAANFLWDFCAYLIPASISCLIIYLYDNPSLVQNFDVLCLSFVAYGLSIIPFTYLLSFLFSSHSTAQNVMIMVYILGGILMTNTAVALLFVPSTADISKHYLRHAFRLIPSFCLGDAIFYISWLPMMEGATRWDLLVSGFDLIYMLVECVVYFALTIAVDKLSSIPSFVGLFKKDPPMLVRTDGRPEEPEDEDVKAERERLQNSALPAGETKFHSLTDTIEQLGAENAIHALAMDDPESQKAEHDLIRLEGLRKIYPGKNAVKDVYFGIPAGQCFGFLGVNGAGKTTTLKIMTGDVTPTQGQGFIGGYSIAHYPTAVRRLMGYCPQHDALFDLLTARETLRFYGTIRGIPVDKMERMITFLIDRLSLTEFANRPCGTYSGGNKRKLSVAIALVGNPPCVFLDEPSTGMDPVSRRFMWDFISETMANRAVILTTHSMEECEALCSRIGILVNGAMKCIGPSQHLKSRFGRGFQVDISTASNDSANARAFLLQHFPEAEKLEDYAGKMKYKILHKKGQGAGGASSPGLGDKAAWRLKDIFALIERHKESVGISEYSVSQTSLEQVFIQFARKGDHEEFGGKLSAHPDDEEEGKEEWDTDAEGRPPRSGSMGIHRVSSFETEDRSQRIVTPSSFGYIPADSNNRGINF